MPEEKFSNLIESVKKFFNSVFETGTFTVGEFQNVFQKFFTDTEKKFSELGYRENRTTEVENILVPILDDAGDFIVTSPVLREIRKKFSDRSHNFDCQQIGLSSRGVLPLRQRDFEIRR